MMHFQVLFAAVASLCFATSNAQSIGAFYTLGGPTIVSLDQESGNFLYNIVSQNGSYSVMQSIRPVVAPRLDTAIACTGYSNGPSIYVKIFYQSTNNSIAQQYIKCLASSGNCVNYAGGDGSYLISTNVTTPVKPGTALAASLFSSNFGFRVTYEDIHGAMRQLSWASPKIGNITVVSPWGDGALILNSTVANSSTISTTEVMYTINGTVDVKPSQQTVYRYSDGQITPFVDDNVGFPNSTANDTWAAAPAISNLVNFSSENGSFATAIHGDYVTLFYIDTTRQLQYVRSTDNGSTWQMQPQESKTVWPLADIPSASVSAAQSINVTDNTLSVFYVSGKKMIQTTMTDNTWVPNYVAVAALPSNTTTTTPITSSTPYQAPHKDTKSIKIGASVGAVAAFLLILGAMAWYLIHQKRPAPSTSSSEESFGKWKESESGFSFTGKAELHNDSTQIYELDHDPECLLLHQLQAYRMYEARGEIPVEIEGKKCTGGRAELDHSLCKCELDAAVLSELPTFCEKGGVDEDEAKSENGSETWSEGTSKGKGKEKEVTVEVTEVHELGFSMKDAVVQLPMWSWAILRREAEEQGKGLDLDLEKGLSRDLEKGMEADIEKAKDMEDST